MALSAVARSLETAAKAGSLDQAGASVEAIEAELAHVRPLLADAGVEEPEGARACG